VCRIKSMRLPPGRWTAARDGETTARGRRAQADSDLAGDDECGDVIVEDLVASMVPEVLKHNIDRATRELEYGRLGSGAAALSNTAALVRVNDGNRERVANLIIAGQAVRAIDVIDAVEEAALRTDLLEAKEERSRQPTRVVPRRRNRLPIQGLVGGPVDLAVQREMARPHRHQEMGPLALVTLADGDDLPDVAGLEPGRGADFAQDWTLSTVRWANVLGDADPTHVTLD